VILSLFTLSISLGPFLYHIRPAHAAHAAHGNYSLYGQIDNPFHVAI
jgi:hypothetical protein